MKKKQEHFGLPGGYAERWALATIIMIGIGALYMLLRSMNLVTFAVTADNAAGLIGIFVLGIVASTSTCMALVGGLLLSVSAVWAERTRNLTPWRRFVPLLHFNVGRLLGYAVFGGLTGLIGSKLVPSIAATGVMKILVAIVLIMLGLRILHLVPKEYCTFPLPKNMQKKLMDLSTSDSAFAPYVLGAITFFIPCGFTQSVQLIALASGDFVSGAIIMLVFALGTLPALLGISVASSSVQGNAAKNFYIFTGALSLFLGIISLHGGLLLTGVDVTKVLPQGEITQNSSVVIDENGQQIINVTVTNRGYDQTQFVVEAGRPTWIAAFAPTNVSGCLNSLVLPSFNMSIPITEGMNWIGPFTPTRDFSFICSQGIFKADVFVR